MGNEVEVGTARLGHVFDGDPQTPHTSALLRRDERRIWLEVPWSGTGDYYRSWFSEFDGWPGRLNRPVPNSLVFEDSKGPVLLAGLEPWGASNNLMSEVGLGRLKVDYAIPGTRTLADYTAPTSLRSDIDGLGSFIRDRSIRIDYGAREESDEVLSLHVTEREPVALDEARGLSCVRSYQHIPKEIDVHEVSATCAIKTEFSGPVPLGEHLRTHRAIQALLGVVYGYPCGFTGHAATVDIRGDSAEQPSEWLELVTSRTGIGQQDRLAHDAYPLFTFNTIGSAGVSKWLSLFDRWPRAMLPLAALVRMRSNMLEAQFVTLGIGLEALGFYLAVEGGKSKSAADDLHLDKKFDLILAAAPFAKDVVGSDWSRRTRDLYTKLKHPTYDYPDMQEVYELLRDSMKLFRLWAAHRLGVPIDANRIAMA